MTQLGELAGDHVRTAYIPGQATAGTDDSWPIFRAPRACTITAVRFIPAASASGAATNNNAVQVINKGAANAGTTGITAVKTYGSGTDSVANTSEALTLSTTAADLVCAVGDVLALVRTHNGTGLAQVDGLMEVAYRNT